MDMFLHSTDLDEIFGKYNCSPASFVNMQIGCDRRLYMLFKEKNPDKLSSESCFFVISFDVDRENEQIHSEQFYDLGKKKMDYFFLLCKTVCNCSGLS